MPATFNCASWCWYSIAGLISFSSPYSPAAPAPNMKAPPTNIPLMPSSRFCSLAASPSAFRNPLDSATRPAETLFSNDRRIPILKLSKMTLSPYAAYATPRRFTTLCAVEGRQEYFSASARYVIPAARSARMRATASSSNWRNLSGAHCATSMRGTPSFARRARSKQSADGLRPFIRAMRFAIRSGDCRLPRFARRTFARVSSENTCSEIAASLRARVVSALVAVRHVAVDVALLELDQPRLVGHERQRKEAERRFPVTVPCGLQVPV